VAWAVAGLAGGVGPVLAAASEGGRLAVLPEPDAKSVLAWVSAALVVVLGSIPQQDDFQRVRSARDERSAVAGSIAGGFIYLAVAAIPIFLAAAATVIDPAMVARLALRDPQLILPTLILERTPLAVQALFFGALVSAILSTAAGALLAPAVLVAENLVLPRLSRVDDRRRLLAMRLAVLAIAGAVTAMALASNRSIYELVNESGKVVLVTSFVPLAAGLFWKRATSAGALAAFGLGLATWIGAEAFAPGASVPPPLAGLLASLLGMAVASLAGEPRPR
jgi:Na+/proline symporter